MFVKFLFNGMKRLFLLLIILCGYSVYSQNGTYSILIKDIDTQLPIENATLIILKTDQILLSNKDGIVAFQLRGASSIEISEPTYYSQNIRWALLEQNDFVIYLKSKSNKLDEIILSRESPQKTLQKIVANSIQKLTVPARIKVYVREFFKLNHQYAYYNDGLVNFQFSKKQKKLITTLLVEQNRSYGLIEDNIAADLLGYNLNNLMENYCTFKYLEPILETKMGNEYEFVIKAHKSNDKFYIMSIIPIDESKGILDTFEIIYDPVKKIINEYTIKIAFKKLENSIEKEKLNVKNITKSSVQVSYRLDDQGYYLLKANEEIAYDLTVRDKLKSVEVRNSFITTDFNKEIFTYKENDVFKEKTLFNKNNKILTNYWDLSGFIATDEEKAIVNGLAYKM
ncbi:hypothetical protein FLFR108385_07450 [Flavobacterium frigoris]